MSQFPLGFTKCPECQKYSINILPAFGFPENRIAGWECPYCFLILEGENWKKNIVEELKEDIKGGQGNLLFGKILTHALDEISPNKAKELAAAYLNNLKIKEFPPSFKNIKVSDYGEEWQVDFDKITLKEAKTFPPNYCVIVNKKTREINQISFR
ncbi:MAG: hypothetical protein ABH813_01850 [Patescibacteria group bacterium]